MPIVQVNNFETINASVSQFDQMYWLTAMLIAGSGIGFFMLFKLRNYAVFQILVFNSYNTKFLKENYENRGAFWSLNLVFYFNYLIQWAFCAFQAKEIYPINFPFDWSFIIFLSLAVFVLLSYNFFKLFLIKTLDKVFSEGDILMINAFSSQYIFALLGIILSFSNLWFINSNPLVQKQVLIINGILISFAYFYKIIRFFIISLQEGVFPYYIILYLCTFEILPILILGKIIIG